MQSTRRARLRASGQCSFIQRSLQSVSVGSTGRPVISKMRSLPIFSASAVAAASLRQSNQTRAGASARPPPSTSTQLSPTLATASPAMGLLRTCRPTSVRQSRTQAKSASGSYSPFRPSIIRAGVGRCAPATSLPRGSKAIARIDCVPTSIPILIGAADVSRFGFEVMTGLAWSKGHPRQE